MKDNKNLLLHSIIEILAAAVNFTVFFALCYYGINYLDANAAAWIAALIFTYPAYRRTTLRTDNNWYTEFLAFCSLRFTALLIETFLLFITVDWLGLSLVTTKIAVSIITVIKNYSVCRKKMFIQESDHQ